jgi:hypothetical protein
MQQVSRPEIRLLQISDLYSSILFGAIVGHKNIILILFPRATTTPPAININLWIKLGVVKRQVNQE